MLFLFSDVDECQTPGRCPYSCTNTAGSYTCGCPSCYDQYGANCILNQCKINNICYRYNRVNPHNPCQVLTLQCSGSLTKFVHKSVFLRTACQTCFWHHHYDVIIWRSALGTGKKWKIDCLVSLIKKWKGMRKIAKTSLNIPFEEWFGPRMTRKIIE